VKLAAAALGLLAGLFLVEAGLRLGRVSYPEFWQNHPVLNTCLAPNTAGWHTEEGRGWVEINAEGFRGPLPVRPKPAGLYRVIALGDSFTEAVQVDADKTFLERARRRLSSCPALAGRTVEILNWGCRASGTGEALLRLAVNGPSYQPDLVLLNFYPENDVLENLEAMRKPALSGCLTWSAASAAVAASCRLEACRPHPWWTRLRLVQLVSQARRVRQKSHWRRHRKFDPWRADYDGGAVYRQPDAELAKAWQATDKLLHGLKTAAASLGAPLVLALVSSPAQVYPDLAAREALFKNWKASDPFAPDRRLMAAAKRLGVAAVDLPPILWDEVRKTGAAVHGFPGYLGEGHWNERGHELVGDAVAEAICREASR